MRNIVVIALCCLLVLTACSSYQGAGLDDEFDVSLPASPELPPIDNNRFTFAADQDVVGQIQVVTARYEDTFVDLARAYGLGFDDLVAANPDVDPWLPGEGTVIVLPTQYVLPLAPRRGIVLNIASKRLFYFHPVADGDPQVVETFPIGIGRTGWATPTGVTSVVSRVRDPVWFVPKSVRAEHLAAGDPLPRRVQPGPDNPLGHYALGLGLPGYLIHGTNKPAGVGMRVSHGCIRLFPEDIEYIFGQVEIGTQVRIVNQPYLLGWRGNWLYLEAHTPLDEDKREWLDLLLPMARSSLVESGDMDPSVDEARLHKVADEQRGYPVPAGRRSADAEQQAPAVRHVTNILAERNPVPDSMQSDNITVN